MSIRIKYAYLSNHTWMYRRNYPEDVRLVLGSQALKRSLQTSDPKVARERAAEVNTHYDALVAKTRSGLGSVGQDAPGWVDHTKSLVAHLRATLEAEEAPRFATKAPVQHATVGELARAYLGKRSNELRLGGFKSVRYSVGLFASHYGDRAVPLITRDDGREFFGLLPELARVIGKSHRTRGFTLAQALEFSKGRAKIAPRTQKRIWSQVCAFLDWSVYEGHRDRNPFKTVKFDRKVKGAPYAVLKDEEVVGVPPSGGPV